MPDEARATGSPLAGRIPLTVRGLYRGSELAGDGWLELADSSLSVAVERASLTGARRGATVAYDAIDGALLDDAHLTLFLGNGDTLDLGDSPRLGLLAREIARRACALPELTLRLRALGSARANPGSDHDRFFGPLLAARRATESETEPARQLAAFDATVLRAHVARTLDAFARDRFPESPADRRALEAELDELGEPLVGALDALGAAAEAARTAADDARFVRWREWATAVRHAFEAADRCWIAALPVLCDSRGREGRLWRRVLGERGPR